MEAKNEGIQVHQKLRTGSFSKEALSPLASRSLFKIAPRTKVQTVKLQRAERHPLLNKANPESRERLRPPVPPAAVRTAPLGRRLPRAARSGQPAEILPTKPAPTRLSNQTSQTQTARRVFSDSVPTAEIQMAQGNRS